MNASKAVAAFRIQSQSESEGFASQEQDSGTESRDAASESEGFAR